MSCVMGVAGGREAAKAWLMVVWGCLGVALERSQVSGHAREITVHVMM